MSPSLQASKCESGVGFAMTLTKKNAMTEDYRRRTTHNAEDLLFPSLFCPTCWPGHDGVTFFPESIFYFPPFLSGFFFYSPHTHLVSSVRHVGAYLRVHVQCFRSTHHVVSGLNRLGVVKFVFCRNWRKKREILTCQNLSN